MSPQLELGLLGLLAVALIAGAIWIVLRQRNHPDRRERQRRLTLQRTGRLGDAVIHEVTEEAIFYSYSIRGVQYQASQDIRPLREFLPEDLDRVIGVAHLKYSSNNPANSIVVCEEWSGLPNPRPAASKV
jgi:hypothetical protein